MTQTIRLLTIANVIHFWDFIESSLMELSAKHNEPIDIMAFRKTLHWLVKDHERAWVAVVTEEGVPVSFAVAFDTTPPFEQAKIWAVKWFYHKPGNFNATLLLKKDFESFARDNNISSYLVTTARLSGGAIRCFQSERYGFKKAFLTFERKL